MSYHCSLQNKVFEHAGEALGYRMCNFKEPDSPSYDGYPTMTCADECLVSDAMQALSDKPEGDQLSFLPWVASMYATDRREYANCRKYINEVVENAWLCNMIEGQNPVHEELREEEEAAEAHNYRQVV